MAYHKGVEVGMCYECVHYDDSNTYEGTGFCNMHQDFVKDADSCDDWSDD